MKDNKKFFKIHFITLTVFVLTIILLSHFDYISNYVIYRSNGGIRNSLGFVHPNSLGLMIYSLTVCSLNLFEIKRFKSFFYLFLLLMNLWVLQLADSRTSGYISILVILLCYFFDKMDKLNRPLNSFFINLAITVSVLFITLMSINFEANSIFQFLNKLFTNRIFSSYIFFREYGISLFGKRIDAVVSLVQGTVIIDSGYIGLLLQKGIIFFVLFLIFIFSRIKEYSFTLRESILLISVFISLMFESYGYTVFLFPILFFDYLGKRKESINE
ncbi:hypothetical protein [Streptococcus mitis]|uniref:hypothetical protein n=1 Tax=Streptococcus mitis TaxID=28037 RepID=UPI0021B70FE6|nr:hypothetical protein [Streptococcus mitis]